MTGCCISWSILAILELTWNRSESMASVCYFREYKFEAFFKGDLGMKSCDNKSSLLAPWTVGPTTPLLLLSGRNKSSFSRSMSGESRMITGGLISLDPYFRMEKGFLEGIYSSVFPRIIEFVISEFLSLALIIIPSTSLIANSIDVVGFLMSWITMFKNILVLISFF